MSIPDLRPGDSLPPSSFNKLVDRAERKLRASSGLEMVSGAGGDMIRATASGCWVKLTARNPNANGENKYAYQFKQVDFDGQGGWTDTPGGISTTDYTSAPLYEINNVYAQLNAVYWAVAGFAEDWLFSVGGGGSIWARVTASDNGTPPKYTWQQLIPDGNGGWNNGPQSGNPSGNPAFEANGGAAILNKVYTLFTGLSGEWIYWAGSGTTGTFQVQTDCVDGSPMFADATFQCGLLATWNGV